jgi:hypothetical protein
LQIIFLESGKNAVNEGLYWVIEGKRIRIFCFILCPIALVICIVKKNKYSLYCKDIFLILLLEKRTKGEASRLNIEIIHHNGVVRRRWQQV